MTAAQLNGWIAGLSVLVQSGALLASQVRNIVVSSSASGVAEKDLDAILTAVGDDARRRAVMARLDKAQAAADAGRQP